ncbi:hypothetical protein NQ504_10410 [Ligilactobacillus ruminis]|uniref:Uncharacterized protein n=1 Tax=Ligilactobacillus ruminis ATCC 25644 TaxID=525362 RepID=E7FS20_9LACO|nr:hypothetical protein [Ligilactobacillus ruminis]EFZ34063.1 hypothetical protein HMPREF0542_11697 [Ligilactobacillus ruminis ATCC 25644]EGX98529.1 hypothetical protein ANHS_898 [Ligilactobacillus ruminis ATCC 25644]UWP41218.1 hypothetical protein NQ504_10410 [Ligilactobacillus ruminis]
MIKIRAMMARIFSYSGRHAKISLKFTDKAGFLEHLSVKPGPKRLNFYRQAAVFAHFVRNLHFLGRPFTDSMPIFIDVSVNGSDFAKGSAAHHLLNRCT